MAQKSLPRLSRVEFFRFREDELASSLARAIAKHVEQFADQALTGHQAAVSAWASVATNVQNGGFTQFFYNNRGDHGVAELVALLEALDLSKAAAILRDATAIYQLHRNEFNVSDPWDGLFGSIEALDNLDESFMSVLPDCNRALDQWTREHVTGLATDESGTPIDPEFTGTVEIRYSNCQIKESLEVEKGKPHGAYREYFLEDGSVRQGVLYVEGKIVGDFWPNGQLKRKEHEEGKNRVIEWFYPNGALQNRYVNDEDGNAAEPIRLFHENGALAEELNTVKGKKRGSWLKFFTDGTPELQAEYGADEALIVHNAWNEKREQMVKNGTGTFRDYAKNIDWEYDVFRKNGWTRESELEDGVPHGKVTLYSHGVLWRIAQYVNGKPNGESTAYWDNGRIRSMTKLVNGTKVSEDFPKFDLPTPAVLLSVEANEELYAAWRHIHVDEYPRVLNLAEVRNQLEVPQFLREVHERNLAGKLKEEYEDCNTFNDGIAYLLAVDEFGSVTAATANGSGVYSGGDWNTYPPLLRKLRFAPGRIRGRAIECQVLARVDHTFIEHGS